jgi:hypothetical protein
VNAQFQARWISKKLIDRVRKTGALRDGLVFSSCKGFIVVEPKGESIGDGQLLTREAARYELDPVWCLDSPLKLKKARHMLGLDTNPDVQTA